MKVLTVLVAALCLTACSTTTVVTLEDGRQITITAGKHELVEFTKGGEPFKMDRRGRPGILEQIGLIWGATGVQKEAE